MGRRYCSLDKLRKRYFSFFILLIATILLASFCSIVVAANTYIPAAPSGSETGFLNINYEYTIYTTSSEDEWMFDWGDGTTSEWISRQGSENSIKKSHSWDSIGEYQIKVKFRNSYFTDGVWSIPVTMTISKYSTEDIPNTPVIPSGNCKGCNSAEYSFSTYAIDPKNDNLQYRFDFGDGTISDWTTPVSSGATSTVSHIWTSTGNYEIKAQAKDQYGLLSEWSEKLDIVIELDTDLDRLSDNIEIQLGSNSNDASDVTSIKIDEEEYFVISISDGSIVFYNPFIESVSLTNSNDDGTYLIDKNNDGIWNYIYNPTEGSIINYETSVDTSSLEIPWTIVGLTGVIAGIILTILILIKTGYIYLYEEEQQVDE